jgi:hypothetical protein
VEFPALAAETSARMQAAIPQPAGLVMPEPPKVDIAQALRRLRKMSL